MAILYIKGPQLGFELGDTVVLPSIITVCSLLLLSPAFAGVSLFEALLKRFGTDFDEPVKGGQKWHMVQSIRYWG